MKMKAHFTNVSRPKDVQTQIDCTFRDVLLDLCNGVETAQKLRDQFRSSPHKTTTDWNRFYRQAYREATSILTDKERKKVSVELDFV